MSGYGFPTYSFGQPNTNSFMNINDNQYNRYMNMLNAQQNQQPKSDTNADFIIVSNIDEAKNSIVQNGQIRWFRHSSKPEVYVKAVSMTGQPSFNAYKLEEFNFEQSNEKNNTNFVTMDKFTELNNVTMDKFSELNNEVAQLKDIVANQNNYIKNMSGNKSTKPSNKEAK